MTKTEFSHLQSKILNILEENNINEDALKFGKHRVNKRKNIFTDDENPIKYINQHQHNYIPSTSQIIQYQPNSMPSGQIIQYQPGSIPSPMEIDTNNDTNNDEFEELVSYFENMHHGK